MTDVDDISRAPKFHKDRSSYAEALRTWLGRQRPDVTDITIGDIEIPSATGFSNETVFFDAGWTEGGTAHHAKYVGRIEPPTGALFPAQTAECSVSVGVQHRIMAAVAETTDLPMPPLVGYESDPSVLGQPFFVMGFVPGVVPADVPRYSQAGFLVDEATPAQRHSMVRNGLKAMAGIHGIDWRAAGLHWLDASGTGEPTTAVQLRVYREFVSEMLRGREHPVMDAALDWLAANDPHDERVGLSWGDSRLGNIIWRNYEPVVVCDWEACALSPTEADVGWWLMFDRMSFDDLGAERMEGFPTREEMVDIYEEVSGREVRDPHYWEVFGAMRFCAIMIPLSDRMVGAGLVPESMNMAVANAVTDALAILVGIDNPTPPVS
jgi:aminoglycoside phosphotransferase (APT) family kinase protein